MATVTVIILAAGTTGMLPWYWWQMLSGGSYAKVWVMGHWVHGPLGSRRSVTMAGPYISSQCPAGSKDNATEITPEQRTIPGKGFQLSLPVEHMEGSMCQAPRG